MCACVQIPKNVVVGTEGFEFTSNGEGSSTDPPDLMFVGSDSVFEEQFMYCHALHACRSQVHLTCSIVSRMRDDIMRASRIGLTRHSRPYEQRIPNGVSPTHL